MRRNYLFSAFCFAVFLLCACQTAFPFDHSDWDVLLKNHVIRGRVDYDGFRRDRVKLQDYLQQIGQFSIQSFAEESREDRIALWINVYNASVIDIILEHYPVDTIKDIPGFWDDKIINVAGMLYSLRDIRDRVFRQGFRDERALLALVSGTKSSPLLRPEAYDGAILVEQLKDQMAELMADERFSQIRPGQKKIMLSPIFRETGRDFVLGYGMGEADKKLTAEQLGILSFIRIHIEDPQKKAWIEKRKYKLDYLPEDLSLNRPDKLQEKTK